MSGILFNLSVRVCNLIDSADSYGGTHSILQNSPHGFQIRTGGKDQLFQTVT